MQRGRTAAEMLPDRNSLLFERRWLSGDDRPWRVWRESRGMRTIAGDYSTKDEAERAIRQLQKLPGALSLEFTGKNICHQYETRQRSL